MNPDITFGQVVKERRSLMGLTQTELARRVGCAAITIRKIEADALRPSVQMAELIALALNIPEEEQLAFVRLARAESKPSPLPTPSPNPGEIGLTNLSGRAVKGFQLGEKIGSGGFGVVYRAVQPTIERDVAVKIILPKYANHPNFIRRFEAEAQLIARLEHPHIVPLYDYWREPDAAYLIMRLLHGGSLEDQLQNGPIPVELVHQYVQQIGLALDVAHRNGVIHRDIKPANVLLDEETNAYLADFGIAKNLETINGKSLTEGGVMIGSPAYISPEQILAEPVKPQSDIYCLGIMLFEMLTGEKPFSGPTPAAYLQQHLNESLPSLQTFNSELPPELDEVIKLATARSASDRYRNVPSLLEDLQQVLSAGESLDGEPVEAPVVLSTEELADLENPYKGLRAFTEADAEQFHGRSSLIQELFAQLSEETELVRFLAIVGPSGSGKSSVAKAGLVPALRRGGLPGSENWFILDLMPGAHPWEEVEAALLRVAVNPPETLLNQLQDGDRGLLRAVNRVLPDDVETELVLIIDQFEEIFTLVEDEEVREQFLNSLVTAVLDQRSRLRVILTLRADFYDRPLQYLDFGDLLRQRTVSVLPMTPDELEQAINKPALESGVHLEPGLAATIIREVGDQPGTLPLLQYVLTELFEERNKNLMTLAAYEAIGGVTGALAQRADEIYNKLDENGRFATRQLFLRLITLGEGIEDTRRRVRLSELEAIQTSEVFEISEVLEEYGRYRLLTFDHDPVTREPTVEVAHEAIIREWNRLRQWLKDSRDDIRQERAVARATEEWDRQQRDVSFLLIGTRLDQIETWQETTTIMLTPLEQEFIAQSQVQREKERQTELARQEREAQLERRSRNFLRGLVAVFALAAIISAALGLFALRQRQVALDNAAEAQNLALVSGSQAALANNDTDSALALAWQAVTMNPESALAQAQLSEAAYTPGTVRRFSGHEGIVYHLAVSPDGQKLLSGAEHGPVFLWDIATGEIIHKLEEHTNNIGDVAFSPNGNLFVSASEDYTTIIWDAETGEKIHTLGEHTEELSAVEFSPDGTQIITGDFGQNSTLILWDVQSGEMVQRYEHDSPIVNIQFMPDGASILFGDFDGSAILLDLETGEIIQKMTPDPDRTLGPLSTVALSPDGKMAMVGFQTFAMYLWDMKTGELIKEYNLGDRGAVSVVFHPTNQTVLVGDSGYFEIIDLQSGDTVFTLSGITGDIYDIAFLPDERYIVTTTNDEIRLWDLEQGQVEQQLANMNSRIMEIDLSPDDQLGLTGTGDGVVTVWDMKTGEPIRQMVDNQPINAVTFSPDGQTALSGAGYVFAEALESGHVILWDVRTGEKMRRFEGQPYAVIDVEFSPDGKLAASSGAGAMAMLWDVETGKEIWRFDDYFVDEPWVFFSFWDVEFSPDGHTLLAAHSSGEIKMIDVETGQEIGQLMGHEGGMPGVVFNEDGQLAASGGWDGQAIVWDMQDLTINHRFTNHNGPMGQVRFSPDSRYLLGGSVDGTGSLWDVETGEVIRRYNQGGFLRVPDFSADGRQALIGLQGGRLELWRIDTTVEGLMAWVEANRYIPELTCGQRELYNIEPLCDAE
jgi:WD40 repeat protein/serine/threonine protein kinase/DNA-binding XRE family transcriptional regulator